MDETDSITRDIGADDVKAGYGTMSVVDGVTYYHAVACDGWPTGPCKTPEKAMERVRAYERCEEVSEAAPGQASRAQMAAFLAWANGQRPGFGFQPAMADRVAALLPDAIRAGLHSDAWVRASQSMAVLNKSRILPLSVIEAGGTMVRRRLPETAIPTRSM